MRMLALFCLFALGLPAQTKDFLTADEADQIREAQDPNIRIQLYLSFAKQRIKLVESLISKEKAGRASMIHDTIEEYTKIIEAIDTVSDDALKRGKAIDEGAAAVAKQEKEFADSLAKIRQKGAKDIARYEFALDTAIETTKDSIEVAQADLGERKRGVQAKQVKDKKDLEEMMQPKDREEKKAEEKKTAEAETKRKAPTLRRKGEAAKKDQ